MQFREFVIQFMRSRIKRFEISSVFVTCLTEIKVKTLITFISRILNRKTLTIITTQNHHPHLNLPFNIFILNLSRFNHNLHLMFLIMTSCLNILHISHKEAILTQIEARTIMANKTWSNYRLHETSITFLCCMGSKTCSIIC